MSKLASARPKPGSRGNGTPHAFGAESPKKTGKKDERNGSPRSPTNGKPSDKPDENSRQSFRERRAFYENTLKEVMSKGYDAREAQMIITASRATFAVSAVEMAEAAIDDYARWLGAENDAGFSKEELTHQAELGIEKALRGVVERDRETGYLTWRYSQADLRQIFYNYSMICLPIPGSKMGNVEFFSTLLGVFEVVQIRQVRRNSAEA